MERERRLDKDKMIIREQRTLPLHKGQGIYEVMEIASKGVNWAMDVALDVDRETKRIYLDRDGNIGHSTCVFDARCNNYGMMPVELGPDSYKCNVCGVDIKGLDKIQKAILKKRHQDKGVAEMEVKRTPTVYDILNRYGVKEDIVEAECIYTGCKRGDNTFVAVMNAGEYACTECGRVAYSPKELYEQVKQRGKKGEIEFREDVTYDRSRHKKIKHDDTAEYVIERMAGVGDVEFAYGLMLRYNLSAIYQEITINGVTHLNIKPVIEGRYGLFVISRDGIDYLQEQEIYKINQGKNKIEKVKIRALESKLKKLGVRLNQQMVERVIREISNISIVLVETQIRGRNEEVLADKGATGDTYKVLRSDKKIKHVGVEDIKWEL